MDDQALILIGRVEGKVDTLINLHSAQSARIDALETRQSRTEVDVASLSASKSNSQSWLSNVMSALAVIVAAIAAYVSYK